MRAIVTGLVAAAMLALAAAFVLTTQVQETSTEAFQTSGVRL